jgi:hypothetical protein
VLARFEKAVGTITGIRPSRTFVDGVYCRDVAIVEPTHSTRSIPRVFFTNKLISAIEPASSGAFYFWNSHCYAFRSDAVLIEDIDGARASYFKRDRRLLALMACSIVLLPVTLYVVAKKLIRASTREQMRHFLTA